MKRFSFVLLIVLGIFIFDACSKADLGISPTETLEPKTTATLKVKAVDSDFNQMSAEVFLNGEFVGTTPYEQEIAFGQHDVAVRLDGHFKFRTIVEADGPGEINVLAEMRTLPVSSSPIARVVLKARSPEQMSFIIEKSGEVLFTVDNAEIIDEILEPEVYTLKASVDGYEPWQLTVNLRNGDIFVQDVTLYPTSRSDELLGIRLSPSEFILSPSKSAFQLHVIATYSQSGERTVTWQSQLSSDDLEVASVDANGWVSRGDSAGVAYIKAEFQGLVDSMQVTNRQAEPGFGRIGFESDPIYAGVTLLNEQGDAIEVGTKATPFTIEVPVGSYSYIIWLNGYEPVGGTVQVFDNFLSKVRHYLQPKPGQSYGIFSSTPGNSSVQVYNATGKLLVNGENTPFILELPDGPYTYRMSLSDYRAIEGGFEVGVGQTALVHGYFNEKLPTGFGEVGISTSPIYAGVQLFDSMGSEVDVGGKATPFTMELPVGSYSYIIWLNDYLPASGTFTIREGRLTSIYHELQLAVGSKKPEIIWNGELVVFNENAKKSQFTISNDLGQRELKAIITYTPGQRSEDAILRVSRTGKIISDVSLPDLDRDDGHHREYPEVRDLGQLDLPVGEYEIEFISTGSGSAVLTHLIAL